MGHKTPLYELHESMGGKLVDFGGWDMPLHYGSQLEEHNIVRQDSGMFDVSHMTIVDVSGQEARKYLQYLVANDVARLEVKGKALYTAMLNEQGGIIDDLIIYLMTEKGSSNEWYRLVVNCATREKDLAWMADRAIGFDVTLNEQPELAMVAVQGPKARAKVAALLGGSREQAINELSVFQGFESEGWFIARTGYTGEDGLEIMVPDDEVAKFWSDLAEAGVAPCGLGARDTLRLEAGMNLYGSDMTDTVTPLESGIAWSVAFEPADRQFVGRDVLDQQKVNGGYDKLVGLVLETRGVLRGHQRVIVEGVGEGEITSGTFSPTLGFSVALARVPAGTGTAAKVEMRGKEIDVRVVRPPFVRNGKKVFE